MYDTLIVGGKIVDGSGRPAYSADVALADGCIAAIGRLAESEACRRVDAAGLVIAPGFIDPHVHSEIGLLTNGCAAAAIAQGVTTHLLGADGFGYAPLSPARLAEMREHLASIHDAPTLGWDWRTYDEYISLYDRRVPINVAGQVPHHAIRLEVMGWNARHPSATEMDRMKGLTADVMSAGAVAFATGLDYFPGLYSDTEELIELCRVVARYGGVFVAHVRYWLGSVEAGVREALQIGQAAGVPVHLSHLFGGDELFELLETARRDGLDVSFDSYPYTAGVSPLTMFLPHWAQRGSPSDVITRLQEPAVRRRLRDEWVPTLRPPNEWHRYILSGIGFGPNEHLAGRSIAELVGNNEESLVELVCNLLVAERLRVTVIEFWLDETMVRRSMTHPAQMVMTDGVFTRAPHPRGFHTYPRILGHYVRQQRLLSLEDAVRRMSGFPAARFGLRDRGRIEEGMAADIVIFDPEKVSDRGTYQNPTPAPIGISYVFVNGELVLDGGKLITATPGRALRK